MRRSRAGRHLWTEHLRSLRVVLILTVVLLFFMPIALFTLLPEDGRMNWTSTGIMFGGLFIGYAAFHFWEKNWIKNHGNREKGARGEISVGKELEKLHIEGFHIFHDYKPEASGNVDHFLVGEGGVFIVETKAWSGEITTDGHDILRNGRSYRKDDPIKQAKGEATRVRHLLHIAGKLDVRVRPILCFTGENLRVYGSVRDVEITSLGALNRTVMQLTFKVSDEDRLSRSTVRVLSARLSQHLGELPAASPGSPPEKPSRLNRILNKPELLIAAYLLFVFAVSLAFAEKSAAVFSSVVGVYEGVEILRDYFFGI